MTDFAMVALVDRRGWLLMQERDEHPVIDPERWGLPGGAVEPGESPEQAAYRELEEETGIRLDGGLDHLQSFEVLHPHCTLPDRAHVFVGATDHADADIDCREGRQMVFVDPVRLQQLDLTQATGLIRGDLLASDLYHRAMG